MTQALKNKGKYCWAVFFLVVDACNRYPCCFTLEVEAKCAEILALLVRLERKWRRFPEGQSLPVQSLKRRKTFIFLCKSLGYYFCLGAKPFKIFHLGAVPPCPLAPCRYVPVVIFKCFISGRIATSNVEDQFLILNFKAIPLQ